MVKIKRKQTSAMKPQEYYMRSYLLDRLTQSKYSFFWNQSLSLSLSLSLCKAVPKESPLVVVPFDITAIYLDNINLTIDSLPNCHQFPILNIFQRDGLHLVS
jgi:hypothetical protein